MEIILLKDIDNVGYKHDVVTVKNGYGRNYLIPQGLAVIANAANNEKLDALRAEEEAQEAARVEEYKQQAEKLEGKSVKIGVKAGTSGKIFGSVTVIQIANAIQEQYGEDIARKKIVLPDNVKEVGTYPVTINLNKEVQSTIEIELVAE